MTNVIIDYNVGNLANLKNALDFIEADVEVVRTPEPILHASRILLPGVGAFGPAMQHLKDSGMLEAIEARRQAGVPLLGICVGAQLLLEEGEEDGPFAGLGWIPGTVQRFRHQLKVPQIGWNAVRPLQEDPLLTGIASGSYFYFVHSYHMQPTHPEQVLAETDYGYAFASVVRRDNVWGVQFHPEKSQNAGLQLLKNFCTLT